MGQYNLRQLGNQDQRLAKNQCCVCLKDGIKQVIDEASRDSFDYICPNCNPSVVISVSGSLLASDSLEKLEKDSEARAELHADIGLCQHRNYPLVDDNVNYFLGIGFISDIPYTYQDWYSGNLGSNPNKYKGIPSDELNRIAKKQRELFEEAVESYLGELIKGLERIIKESIDQIALLDSEIQEVKRLLNDHTAGNQGITKYGQIEVPNIDINHIQSFYKDAVYSRLDYNCIPSPKQTWRIGTSKKKFELMVIAVAANKYLSYVQEKKSEYLKSFTETLQNKRVKLLSHIYLECKGLTSNSINLKDLSRQLAIDFNEINDLAKSLSDFNYIQFLTKDRDLCLTINGIELIENINKNEAQNRDEGFSPQEIREINIKLDKILEVIETLDLGHEVIFNEIDSLRNDAKRLSKKDFKSMAMGKFFSLGIDGLLDKFHVVDFLKDLVGNDLNRYLK